jgi:hypothetical protein
MLTFALAHRPELRHTLTYADRTWREAIFGEEVLVDLAALGVASAHIRREFYG